MTDDNKSGEPVVDERPRPMMVRVVLEMPAVAEEQLIVLGKAVKKKTGFPIRLISSELVTGKEKEKVKRVATRTASGASVVYRVIVGQEETPLKGRNWQVRKFISEFSTREQKFPTAREIWEGLEQATGEPDMQKAIESSLHSMRTKGIVESVAVAGLLLPCVEHHSTARW